MKTVAMIAAVGIVGFVIYKIYKSADFSTPDTTKKPKTLAPGQCASGKFFHKQDGRCITRAECNARQGQIIGRDCIAAN